MAKKTYGHTIGKDGKPVITEEVKLTRAQRKSMQLIGWTPGPGGSPLKKAARALWG